MTTTTDAPFELEEGERKPDPSAKADELLNQDPQAERPKRGHGGRRPGAGRKSGRAAREPQPEKTVDTSPPKPVEMLAYGMFWRVLFGLGERFARMTPITDQEANELAEASVPVGRKYMDFGGFEAEFLLLLTVGGVVMTHLPKPETPENQARDLGEAETVP